MYIDSYKDTNMQQKRNPFKNLSEYYLKFQSLTKYRCSDLYHGPTSQLCSGNKGIVVQLKLPYPLPPSTLFPSRDLLLLKETQMLW